MVRGGGEHAKGVFSFVGALMDFVKEKNKSETAAETPQPNVLVIKPAVTSPNTADCAGLLDDDMQVGPRYGAAAKPSAKKRDITAVLSATPAPLPALPLLSCVQPSRHAHLRAFHQRLSSSQPAQRRLHLNRNICHRLGLLQLHWYLCLQCLSLRQQTWQHRRPAGLQQWQHHHLHLPKSRFR